MQNVNQYIYIYRFLCIYIYFYEIRNCYKTHFWFLIKWIEQNQPLPWQRVSYAAVTSNAQNASKLTIVEELKFSTDGRDLKYSSMQNPITDENLYWHWNLWKLERIKHETNTCMTQSNCWGKQWDSHLYGRTCHYIVSKD